mmetsp:Transcript_72794/g.173448  ORF Transcript_72794/g.173448 Transcript_72794/m.173448 type:complete len:223 (+) Transcript_72794:1772-2440(+)
MLLELGVVVVLLFLGLRLQILLQRSWHFCTSHPSMVQKLLRLRSLVLFPCKHDLAELLANLRNVRLEFDCLGLDILLILEGKPSRQKTILQDAQRPDVNLETITFVVELRCPERLRATLARQLLTWLHHCDSSKIRKEYAATRINDVAAVHDKVVPLDIAMHHTLTVQPLDGFHHLPGYVSGRLGRNHSMLPPVSLHSFDDITTPIEVEDHAHEDLLMIDFV